MRIMSEEQGRTQAYHQDLRCRIIYQRIGMNRSFKAIARNMNIGQGTAHCPVSHFIAHDHLQEGEAALAK